MRLRKLSLALAGAATGAALLGALPALGADHRDSPATQANAAADINDVYAWTTARGDLVLAMTVNPLTGPADTGRIALQPGTVYEIKLDTGGDPAPEASLKVTAPTAGPGQDIMIRFGQGVDAVTDDVSGAVTGTGKASVLAGVNTITTRDGTKVYVGPRDDPFFFDLAGFNAGLKFTGADTFKGTNVTAIVFEIPKAVVASFAPGGKLGIWATTSRRDTLGNWQQIDRMGRPAINTVFIPKEQKDAFNTNTPDRDATIFKDEVLATLKALNGNEKLADALLPDVLTIDVNAPVKYLNGRGLADDVIDISLQAITGSPTIGDGVNANDRPFSTTFPYLAAPNLSAPGAPNTGSVANGDDGSGLAAYTLPIGLVAAGILFTAAAVAARRQRTGG